MIPTNPSAFPRLLECTQHDLFRRSDIEIDSALASYRPAEDREVPQLVTKGTSACYSGFGYEARRRCSQQLTSKTFEPERTVCACYVVAGITVYS